MTSRFLFWEPDTVLVIFLQLSTHRRGYIFLCVLLMFMAMRHFSLDPKFPRKIFLRLRLLCVFWGFHHGSVDFLRLSMVIGRKKYMHIPYSYGYAVF